MIACSISRGSDVNKVFNQKQPHGQCSVLMSIFRTQVSMPGFLEYEYLLEFVINSGVEQGCVRLHCKLVCQICLFSIKDMNSSSYIV